MGGGGEQGTEDLFAAIHASYAAELPGLVAGLVALVAEAATRPFAALSAREAAHQLRGTAGSYGFAAVGRVAGRIEDALEAGAPVPPALVSAIVALAAGDPEAEIDHDGGQEEISGSSK